MIVLLLAWFLGGLIAGLFAGFLGMSMIDSTMTGVVVMIILAIAWACFLALKAISDMHKVEHDTEHQARPGKWSDLEV